MTGIFILFNLRNQRIKPSILTISFKYIIHMVTIKSGFSIAEVVIRELIIIFPVMFNSLRRELLIRFQIFLYLGRCSRTLWLKVIYYMGLDGTFFSQSEWIYWPAPSVLGIGVNFPAFKRYEGLSVRGNHFVLGMWIAIFAYVAHCFKKVSNQLFYKIKNIIFNSLLISKNN